MTSRENGIGAAAAVQHLASASQGRRLGVWISMKRIAAVALTAALLSPLGDSLGSRSVNAGEAPPPELGAVSAGGRSACAILATGSVTCWGANWSGGLGTGTLYNSVIPQTVSLDGVATQVSTGQGHACALLVDATVRCWGENDSGQVGDVALGYDVLAPTAVPGMDDVVSLSAGAYHTCAVRDDGSVWCWGYGGSGQLGAPDRWDGIPPTDVPGITTAISVAAGDWHTCVLLQDHSVTCFGLLPDAVQPYLTNYYEPTPIAGFDDIVALAAGGEFTCGIRSTGRVRCFGSNWAGQLGDGTQDYRSAPVRVEGVEAAVAVGAGGGHACAATSSGALFCWGTNYTGELGTPPSDDLPWQPPHLVPGISGVTAVDGGWHFTCAVAAGVGSCWGLNEYGQLGDRTRVTRSDPQPISWVPDADAPTATSSTAAIKPSFSLNGWEKKFRVRFATEVDDGLDGTGVDHLEFRASRDGGTTWGPVRWRRAAWNKWVRPIATLIVEVRAVDRVGNVGEWATSPVYTPQLVEETSATITYSGAWLTKIRTVYTGGSAAYSTTAGDSATFTFTGYGFGIVSRKSKNRGIFQVFIDGQDAGVVDLRNRWRWFRVVVFARTWDTPGEHTVQIVNLAEPDRPRIDLDAVVVLG
jgi:alpha-tubulin suppressor-like RCC1 family protein